MLFPRFPIIFYHLVNRSTLLRKNFASTFLFSSENPRLKAININKYISKLEEEYNKLIKINNHDSITRLQELEPIINILTTKRNININIDNLKELIEAEDKDLSDLAKDEKNDWENKLQELDNNLIEVVVPTNSEDYINEIVLEIKAGVGGQEAMLFAQDMVTMYCNFARLKGWDCEIAEYLTTDIGGLRHAVLLLNGRGVFKYFKYEAGVHRVQRIPATEKSGRTHTSTVSVVALPQPNEIEVQIDAKDLRIDTKRATGAGGQHVNTTDSAVRITHLPTNIVVECQTDRSQIKNKKFAMARLTALIYERKLEKQMADLSATRKNQVKSNNRNEKIRTYNYNQDRITDHRLAGVHYHNLKGFMENGQDLDKLILQLDEQSKIDNFVEIVEKTCNN